MNFLGHLYFSDNNPELMYANLYGDFFKGKDTSKHSHVVQSGIILHRSIDSYIDKHPIVVNLMHELYPEMPKVTGIAIDLYFDFLLAKNWGKFHSIPYQEFLNNFYEYNPLYWEEYPTKFKIFISQIKKYRWLDYYPTFEGLKKACEGVSSRISFENNLTKAPYVFVKYEDKISKTFDLYMQDAIPNFKLKIKDFKL